MSDKKKTEDNPAEIAVIDERTIRNKIYVVRSVRVMLDFDLAEIYGFSTSAFNQQVKRNAERFDDDFRFQLTREEVEQISISQIVTSIQTKGVKGGRAKLPWAFTQSGVYMLMTVLKGDLAIQQSKALIRIFQAMKDYIIETQGLVTQRDLLRRKSILLGYDQGHLVGFIGEHLEGSMGILYVFPEYRRRCFGTTLQNCLITKTMEKGFVPFGQVEKGNQKSLGLQDKLGMARSDDLIVWMWKNPGSDPGKITLCRPGSRYARQVMDFRDELKKNGDEFDGCAGLEECASFEEWIRFEERLRAKYKDGYVPSEVFPAVRETDDRLVGIVDYRHPLAGFLMSFGGNIGYSVRPSERRKGYASEMLRLMLDICRSYGEMRVLLICDSDNTASRKTILKNGGVLENEIEGTVELSKYGRIQRYWISIGSDF